MPRIVGSHLACGPQPTSRTDSLGPHVKCDPTPLTQSQILVHATKGHCLQQMNRLTTSMSIHPLQAPLIGHHALNLIKDQDHEASSLALVATAMAQASPEPRGERHV